MSALIHAATMVTAGVFLVCRAHVRSSKRPTTRARSWRGSARSPRCSRRRSRSCSTTSSACSRTRRSASSATCSSRSASARTRAAMFHMVTHAFFKALLFLGAGAVIHGLHDEQDMRRMGALRKWMPITAGTFIVGWLAIAGIFPFVGLLVEGRDPRRRRGSPTTTRCGLVGAVAALFTAFYMTRQVYLVFYGDARWDEVDRRPSDAAAPTPRNPSTRSVATPRTSRRRRRAPTPHESPLVMTLPLVALAFLSIVGGSSTCRSSKQELDFLARLARAGVRGRRARSTSRRSRSGSCSSTVAVDHRGRRHRRRPRAVPERARRDGRGSRRASGSGRFAKVLANAYYFDVGSPASSAARSPPPRGSSATTSTARSSTARSTASRPASRAAGGGLRKVQTGLVRNYALGDHVRRGACSSATCSSRAVRADGRLPDPHRADRPARRRRARSRCSCPTSRPELARDGRLRDERRDLGSRRVPPGRVRPGDAGYQFVSDHAWMEPLGVRWTVGVDGISLFMVVLTALLIPIGLLASANIEPRQVVHRSGCSCSRPADRRVPRARPRAVLRVLRGRARADVLPHRGLGAREPALRRDEVLPVHDGRFRVPVRRDPVRSRSCTAAPKGSSPSTRRCSPSGRRPAARCRSAPRSGCSSRSRSRSQ